MIKNIIFDFDGTIGDSTALIVQCFQDTLSELNLRVCTAQECRETIGLPLRAAFVQLAGVDKDMQEQCVATYEKVFRRNNKPGCVPPFEHVIDTIHELARREIQMTIATSRRSWSAKALLEEMKLIDFMPYILGADEVSNHKPHPEPVLKTLEEQHFKPEETIVVGDTWFDIEMGKRAGVRTAGVTFGNGTKESLEQAGATWIIDDFALLLDIIDKEA